MTVLANILVIVLAVLGGLVLAALICAAVGWFVVRGIRVPPAHRSDDENDLTWT